MGALFESAWKMMIGSGGLSGLAEIILDSGLIAVSEPQNVISL